MSLVHSSPRNEFPVAQWLQNPTDVYKVMGLDSYLHLTLL